MRKIIYFSFLVLGIFACSEEPELEKVFKDEPVEDFEPIEVLFDEDTFENAKMVELLREINICSTEEQENLNVEVANCSPEFFKLFPLKANEPVENGFILLIKANTGGIGLRRLLIFERENGALVKTNGFIGNLIGKRKSDTEYEDLLIRFIDIIDGSDVYYNCLFSWEEGKYQFKSCESIHEPAGNFFGRVKADVKDSVSQEILEIIQSHDMIF